MSSFSLKKKKLYTQNWQNWAPICLLPTDLDTTSLPTDLDTTSFFFFFFGQCFGHIQSPEPLGANIDSFYTLLWLKMCFSTIEWQIYIVAQIRSTCLFFHLFYIVFCCGVLDDTSSVSFPRWAGAETLIGWSWGGQGLAVPCLWMLMLNHWGNSLERQHLGQNLKTKSHKTIQLVCRSEGPSRGRKSCQWEGNQLSPEGSNWKGNGAGAVGVALAAFCRHLVTSGDRRELPLRATSGLGQLLNDSNSTSKQDPGWPAANSRFHWNCHTSSGPRNIWQDPWVICALSQVFKRHCAVLTAEHRLILNDFVKLVYRLQLQ